MNKYVIGILSGIVTIATTTAAIYYKKKYEKEVEEHWKTRYAMDDEAKRADTAEDEAWEVRMIANDFTRFMRRRKGDFAEWLKTLGVDDDYIIADYRDTLKMAEEYYNSKYYNK